MKCIYRPCEDCFICDMTGTIPAKECPSFEKGKSGTKMLSEEELDETT